MRAAVNAALMVLCLSSSAYCFADESSPPMTGMCSRGEAEGTGTCSYETGDLYEVYCRGHPPPRGRAAADLPGRYLPRLPTVAVRRRRGHLTLTCMRVAQGQFDDEGLPHGQGKYFYSGGEAYEGSFVNGHLEGPGNFTYSRCAFRGCSLRLCV